MADVLPRSGTRRREQTRARLLDAAHEVFAEVGMDAFNTVWTSAETMPLIGEIDKPDQWIARVL